MRKRYTRISILLSVVSLSLTLFINIRIAKEYLRVDRKTQIWFWMTEQIQFGYQYYVALIGIAAMVFALLSLRTANKKTVVIVAVALSVVAIALVFMRIWRLFV